MKFLIVSADKFPLFRVDARVLFGEEMARRGHEIDWILQSTEPRKRGSIEAYGNGRAWIGASYAGESTFAKAIRQIQMFCHDLRVIPIAMRNRYSFIQVKDKFVGAIVVLLAARMTGAKFVYWLAYPFPEAWTYDAKTGVARHPIVSRLRGRLAGFLLYRIILPRADIAFVQSEQMKKDIAAKGVAVDRIHAVPMGVSPEILFSVDQQTAPEVRSPAVLYLGSTLRVRRLEFVIEAFGRVLEALPDAKLYIVGGEHESDIDFLRASARERQIDGSVVFTGNLAREEALRWVRAADVCLSPIFPTPILNAASPTKLIEYMALAKPVVANHHPEQTVVIEESGAGLCVPWEVNAFAGAIVTILGDHARATDMGRRGRNYALSHRSYARIAEDVEDVYRTIIHDESRINGH